MGSGIKNAKKKAPEGPRTMIIETHYCNRQEMLAMTHDRFSVDGVEFWITGTTIDEITGEATCIAKNLSNGKSSEIEHQKLCRIIKAELNKNKEVFEHSTINHKILLPSSELFNQNIYSNE